jgi:tRNA wybutosine-synthesizing protein 3
MRRLRDLRAWLEYKSLLIERIYEDRVIGYLDPGAERYLEVFNKPTLLVTTSSCTGRITVVEGLWHWERGESRILYKTHDPLDVDAITKHSTRAFSENIWLKVTGPILHFRTPSLRCASKLLQYARASGFKHSGLLSLNPVEGHTVEVMSGVQLMVPLRREGVSLVDRSYLKNIASTASEALMEGRRRLEMFRSKLSSGLDACEP